MRNKTAMRMGMLGLIGSMIAGGMDMYDPTHHTEIDDRPRAPVIPPTPKGCKEYFFNEMGEFSDTKMRRDECVFTCIAINDKNAMKKFNKWKVSGI